MWSYHSSVHEKKKKKALRPSERNETLWEKKGRKRSSIAASNHTIGAIAVVQCVVAGHVHQKNQTTAAAYQNINEPETGTTTRKKKKGGGWAGGRKQMCDDVQVQQQQ
jgi:hypothetical protein